MLMLIVTCRLGVIYVREDNDSNVYVTLFLGDAKEIAKPAFKETFSNQENTFFIIKNA